MWYFTVRKRISPTSIASPTTARECILLCNNVYISSSTPAGGKPERYYSVHVEQHDMYICNCPLSGGI